MIEQTTIISNQVIFAGNLGRDPEMSYTKGGKALTRFSLGVYQGQGKDTMWLNVICWEALAERVSKEISVGNKVQVEGRLTCRKYEGKSYYDVIASSVEVIGVKRPGNKAHLDHPEDHPF
jgi:single-strand DNA-binding protein